MADTGLFRLVGALLGADAAARCFSRVFIAPALLRPATARLSRAELAQALNLLLFDDLLQRVPVARDYVEDVHAAAGPGLRHGQRDRHLPDDAAGGRHRYLLSDTRAHAARLIG
ncbi:hypothetical protein OOT46_04060 [Aquabacterium sp. A7-Y]|uniref:hypothetical protein n=1 Tax=Aquabacterium sp. A7-Y TaxID=1349605 RepID=UPI00223CBD04|nr:hypothetical protein [Aquabacterium sp. A7-Y]MCW7537026.1 hypothetical protein [Aquabacterium sp. A7-Y]